MDSIIASDATARDIMEKLAVLEKAAGVRAHYRILEPPPLSGTDGNSLQTAARMIGDWIGLRNALFHVVVGESATSSMSGVRLERDQDEFTIDLPRTSVVTPTRALGALSREVARAYLYKTNIRGGPQAAAAGDPTLVDVTAVFLGLGKLLLNGCAGDGAPKGDRSVAGQSSKMKASGGCVLAPTYIAFAHRAACSMRGLDYEQHVTGLTPQALELLRAWDEHRDDLFSLSLRNVLTASATHRPLQEAVSDNQVVLSRFDQLLRHFEATVLAPLMQELAGYHRQCKEAMERIAAPEPETYDPCMVYLNQVRRRMDLQRLADSLQEQQERVMQRLHVLVAGLHSLEQQQLLRTDYLKNGRFPQAMCPLDGTPVNLPEGSREAKVKCPTCGYEFLASPEPPSLSNGYKAQGASASAIAPDTEPLSKRVGSLLPTALRDQKIAVPGARPGISMMIYALVLLAMSWLPLLLYVLFTMIREIEPEHASLLGHIAVLCSGASLLLMLAGLVRYILTLGSKSIPATKTSAVDVQPEIKR